MKEFSDFERKYYPNLDLVTFTQYDPNFPIKVAFPPESLNNFIGQIVSENGLNQYRTAETEKYPHVTNSVSPQELAQGMGEHWRNTGEQLTIDEACQRLEATLDKQERDFFNNPKNIEKFQKYHPGIASKQVKGPQATLSSRFKEQPTRRESEEMSLEEIKARFPLFTP